MNIGFMGLGKLGLPCALAIEEKGHSVCGFDIDDLRPVDHVASCYVPALFATASDDRFVHPSYEHIC